jgi:mycoredoxin
MSTNSPVTIYTGPGCPYCMRLRLGLRRRRITFSEVNIWQDPAAAAAVRVVADGTETVPTVHVAGQWLVNPPARQVEQLARPRRSPSRDR